MSGPHAALPGVRTERLDLRPVSWEGLDLLVALNSEPEVMSLVRGRPSTVRETEEEWRRRLTHQSDASSGLGYWLGFEGDLFAGWWSASWFAGKPEVSGIGYRLRRVAWGRGLATEGASAMVRQAFGATEVERVVASTAAANVRSRRVLEKVGMSHTSTWERADRGPGGGSEVGYELSRTAWEAGRPRRDAAAYGEPRSQ